MFSIILVAKNFKESFNQAKLFNKNLKEGKELNMADIIYEDSENENNQNIQINSTIVE